MAWICGFHTKILNGAFYGTKQLETITLNEGITSIASNAFYGCLGLKRAYYYGDEISDISISNTGNEPLLRVLKLLKTGDTNLDDKISIRDVTAIQRHIAELEFISDEALMLADTNGDGEISIADATHLQKYLAKFDGIVLGKS